MKFWAELRRRKVIRIVVAYLVAAWLIVQVAVTIEAPLALPGWFDTFAIVAIAIGLPIVVVLAWTFDITKEGLRLTPPAPGSGGGALPDEPNTAPHAHAPPAAAPDSRSIAVLPFVNMSSDPDQEYFSDGLSEELMNALAQIEDLRVIARTSCFAFKGKNADVRQIGHQLGVARVLEGSVRKSGDRLRITAQLIDAADGAHLWSQTYDRKLEDVFAIQDEIARAVAAALSVTLGVGKTAATTGDVEAYDLYLRGRALITRFGPADFVRAADMFRRALARDPAFSRARAGLVHLSLFSSIYVPEGRADARRTVEQTAEEARARAPDDWATHLAFAALHLARHEWVDAEREHASVASKAPAAVPEVDELRAIVLQQVGRVADSLEILNASMGMDPLSAIRSFQVQFALGMLGRKAETETEFERSLDLPGGADREDIRHWALMMIWNGGDRALIEQRFDAYLSRQTVATPWTSRVRAVFDDRDAALSVIRAAFADVANDDPTRLQFIMAYAGHYGDVELVLAAARRALVDLRGTTGNCLWWPDMAAARRTPGFKDLVRDMGLADYWRTTGNWGDFARPVGADDFECF